MRKGTEKKQWAQAVGLYTPTNCKNFSLNLQDFPDLKRKNLDIF